MRPHSPRRTWRRPRPPQQRRAQTRFTVSTNGAQFRFSGSHKGVNPYENVLSPATVPRIDENWSFTTGGPVASTPAVVSGVVYVSSDNGWVNGLNASTGAKR